jgi:hypothetical protein
MEGRCSLGAAQEVHRRGYRWKAESVPFGDRWSDIGRHHHFLATTSRASPQRTIDWPAAANYEYGSVFDASMEESGSMNHVSEETDNGVVAQEEKKERNRFATAQQQRRMEAFEVAQQQAQNVLRARKPKRILKQGIHTVKKAIQKVNIGRWIDELEHDQQVADDLERINRDNEEELQRKELVAQVHEMCMNAVKDHLQSFLAENPNGSYEEWIAELHPDNVLPAKNEDGDDTPKIDARFYVTDSDHLLLWNQQHSAD